MNHGIDKEYQSGKHQTVHNIKQPFPRNQKQAQIELPNNSGIVIHILNILLFDQPPQRTYTPCFLCIPVIICKIWRKEIVNSNCNHTSDQDEIKKCFPVFLQKFCHSHFSTNIFLSILARITPILQFLRGLTPFRFNVTIYRYIICRYIKLLSYTNQRRPE